MVTAQIQQSQFSRVWLIPFRAGPRNVRGYHSLARAAPPERGGENLSPERAASAVGLGVRGCCARRRAR